MSEKWISVEDIGPVRLVKNKRSKQLRITVKPSGEVRVSMPWYTTFDSGISFLLSRKEWILETLAHYQNHPPHHNSFQPGVLFQTRNRTYELAVSNRTDDRLIISFPENRCILEFPGNRSPEKPELHQTIIRVLTEQLRKEAKGYLPKRTRELAEQLNFKYKQVFIKNNKSNWGSCSSLGNINLNLHLMRLPDIFIDFVIVHELLHTVIPNHGPEFKATMQRFFPEAKIMEKELKKYHPRFFSN
jgi:predicted metal-dependent hydrolase